MTVTRQSPVTVLPGIGKTRAEYYQKMGIRSLGDLLSHYPRAYENRSNVVLLAEAAVDHKNALLLTVATEPTCVRLRSHKSFLKFRAFDESGSCEIVYFNQDYLKSQFRIGSVFRFFGKVERHGNRFSMSAPNAEPWTEFTQLPPLVPVYRMTEGITPKQIAKDVTTALELLSPTTEDPLPDFLRERRSLCTLAYAERNIHRPESMQALAAARKRLVYDEFFCFALGASITCKQEKTKGAPVCAQNDLAPLLSALPYTLTDAQQRAIREIAADMARDVPMSRILVGDVGCGKTICATAAMLIAVQSGRQAVLMAPTEILARQHYHDLFPIFSELRISCDLLVGATSTAQKQQIKTALAADSAEHRLQVIIGTHALLSDGVSFASPGLVVTDEQHRFGARQRALLSEKNENAHLLVMSATPIPRSLALVLYGDLDISRIDEMPRGRQRVDTFAVDESYRTRLNGFIRKQVSDGGQVYVVCPAVEEQEDLDDALPLSQLCAQDDVPKEDKPPLKAAVTYAKTLQETFPDLTVAFLHGKMKSAEKDDVMHRFAEGTIQILVSTTVIEVGVNVPNACLMIVENAERFGLSQLHQLRGRVGRGTRKSYCILVSGGNGTTVGTNSRARLNVMCTTYDGYRIAEEDLAQRGPGDFLATASDRSVRQSGGLSFRLADAGEDISILTDASADARELLETDGTLSAYPALAERVRTAFTLEAGLIS